MTMQLEGEQRIIAPIDVVWAALNDPNMLKNCIPGCELLHLTSPTKMVASVTVKIGPIEAKFSGVVTLSNINPPRSVKEKAGWLDLPREERTCN